MPHDGRSRLRRQAGRVQKIWRARKPQARSRPRPFRQQLMHATCSEADVQSCPSASPLVCADPCVWCACSAAARVRGLCLSLTVGEGSQTRRGAQGRGPRARDGNQSLRVKCAHALRASNARNKRLREPRGSAQLRAARGSESLFSLRARGCPHACSWNERSMALENQFIFARIHSSNCTYIFKKATPSRLLSPRLQAQAHDQAIESFEKFKK